MKILLVALAALVATVRAGDAGLAVQSALLPGMGQVAAGRGEITSPNTWKGLAIMGGFVFCAHNAFSYLSRQEGYAEETQMRAQQGKEATFFEDKQIIDEQWSRAYDNYKDAHTWALVFSGLTVGVYACGVVDALLFTHGAAKKSDETGAAPAKTELRWVSKAQRNGLEVLHRF